MKAFAADIIIPVWNKPEKTRLCLAELVKHTPEARFILIDNASERETESIIHEFAEALGERALLFRNERARESVAVFNMGLAKADAPFAVLMDNSTVVAKGWLETMLDTVSGRPDVGLAIPDVVPDTNLNNAAKGPSVPRMIEVSHGSFTVLLIRKSLYDRIGGLDEKMDDGVWCLKDYSRRAWTEGFATVDVPGVKVSHEEDVPLGSPARRRGRAEVSMAAYFSQWGEEQSFCVDMSGKTDPVNLRRQFEIMLDGARCGDSYTVFAHRKLYREIVREGYNSLHRSIAVERLPFFSGSRAAERAFSCLRKSSPKLKMIAVENLPSSRPGNGAGAGTVDTVALCGGQDAG